MNKLISRNPVLRFKLGRKIIKAKNSWGKDFGRVNLGINTPTIDFQIPSVEISREQIESLPSVPITYSSYPYKGSIVKLGIQKNPDISPSTSLDPYLVLGSTKGGQLKAADEAIVLELLNYSSEERQGTPPNKQRFSRKDNNSTGSAKENSIVSDKSSGISKKYGFAGDIQRNWRGTKGVITDNDLKLLLEMGFKGKTALEAQDYMNSQFANNGLFGYKVANDNAWGGLSNRALLALYKAWKERQKIKPTTVEKPSPTIQLPQTPTLQRQAISDYSNYAQNLKLALGGNNNFSGLSNLVWKEYADDDNSFAANFSRDMRSRFNNYKTSQDWLSNLQAIENALNISGKYRGSRAGDYGDISRSMANWAGEYNYNIDKQNQQALNNYNALVNKYKKALGSYKQGGQLLSRNIVKRFKNRNFN